MRLPFCGSYTYTDIFFEKEVPAFTGIAVYCNNTLLRLNSDSGLRAGISTNITPTPVILAKARISNLTAQFVILAKARTSINNVVNFLVVIECKAKQSKSQFFIQFSFARLLL